MRLKKKLLKGSNLCVILDSDFIGEEKVAQMALAALSGGADMIQLRDKRSSFKKFLRIAKTVKKAAKRHGVPFIINDRLDVALASDADGIHIGQGDLGISFVKKILSAGKVIGVSATCPAEAKFAEKNKATYLGVGPVFSTPVKSGTRPVGLKILKFAKMTGLPFFAIGGINSKNVSRVTKTGVTNIAVIRAICSARVPYLAAKQLKKAIA